MSFKIWNGEEIRKLRERFNIRQKDFAEMLGARQQQISHWEKKNLTPGKAYQRLLTITYEKLLEENDAASKALPGKG